MLVKNNTEEFNNFESSENSSEKITREKLISFAKEKPPQDPELREMLLKWIEETSLPGPNEKDFLGIEYPDVAIMHSAMKYRLGFLTKKEVLDELLEVR